MSRPSIAVALVLAALSVVAVAGAVTTASTATPVLDTTPGEPNHLAINDSDVAAANATTVDVDVGAAVSADSAALRGTYERLRFERAYANASSSSAQSRLVENTTDRLLNATRRLEARDRENVAAFARGSIDADAFLRERARIQARADRLQGVSERVSSSLPGSLGGDLNAVTGRLEALQGPISAGVLDDLVGGDGEGRIYAEVSDSGYTIANVSDAGYTRETYLGEAYRPEQVRQFPANGTSHLQAAENHAMQLYPWVRANQTGSSVFVPGPGIYRIYKGMPGGEMTVYLDGGTAEVFRESQTRQLVNATKHEAVNHTSDSVRLTVNATYETGPAQVTLRDVTTGEPVDGTVTIGSREPVPVGDDGTHWFVQPRGDVRINATAGTAELSATLPGS